MNGTTEPCAPWPRHVLSQDDWAQLAGTPSPPLLALWADTTQVYALLREPTTGGGDPLLVSTPVIEGTYPALSPIRPIAAWFERMVRDLWGHTAAGGTDLRPLLDHGRWPHRAPMAVRPAPPGGSSEPPELAPACEGKLDQIPLGPIRCGIEPAAHLRLSNRGETIILAKTVLGYAHKGSLALMRGKSPRTAARFAARLSGEATVAHGIAFARATEAALATQIPPRAAALRSIMAEIERTAAHLDDLATIAEATGFDVTGTRCARHGEILRRAANRAFGHRLMMDCVIPGGVAADIAEGGAEAISRALDELAEELPIIEALAPFGAGAEPDSGPCRRLKEISNSTRLARGSLEGAPEGALSVPLPNESGEGVGNAEAPGGEVWHWLRLDHGQIAAVFMCDPAWVRWPRLEGVLADSQVDDLKLTLALFGRIGPGLDL